MGGASSSLTESSPLNTGGKGKTPATVFDDPLEGLRQALTRAKQAKAQPQRRRVRQHFWLSAHDEVEWAEEYYGATSVPVRFLHWINSHTVQMTLVTLLVLDAIAVVMSLFLDAEFPACYIVERDAVSCYNASYGSQDHVSYHDDHGSHHRRLGASGDAHHSLCPGAFADAPSSWPAACDPHKWHSVHTAHDALFWCSVGILIIFAVELLLLLAILRLNFLRNPLYALDAVVVATSLAFEIGLKGEAGGDMAGLLAFGRVWRFVRIGHGLSSAVHEVDAAHLHEVEQHAKALEAEVLELRKRTRCCAPPVIVSES